jgi:ABC-type uncharacterized transport system auxiliary subunit
MRHTALGLTLSAALFMAGCATKPVEGGASTTPSAATSAAPAAADTSPRVSTPVVIPAASARKVVMAMTGSKQVVEAKDWAEFKREWRETFAEHAKAAGIAFSFVEGDVAPRAEDGTLVLVDVADYRIVGIGMRIMFGIMTGNAYIDAKVKYANLRDGKVLGEQQFNTSSSAGAGIFAKVTPQQVDLIGSEVFRDLKAAK